MPIDPKQSSARDALLTEISEELLILEGAELEQFLKEIGEQPASLSEHHERALAAALAGQGKRRLEAARAELRSRPRPNSSNVVALDILKKRALLEAIRLRTEQSGEMTMAARNRKIESEDDLDSFLEACLRLGLINEAGELKD